MKRDRRSELRHAAIMALRKAFPNWTQCNIADALGIDHAAVQYHFSARYKGRDVTTVPTWQLSLVAACKAIAQGDISRARVNLTQAASDMPAASERTAA